ncbi:Predicted arabinose efflux permease, MFS family [Terribacillus halophilus]|uniref:Predicted arabinose efflux permease, MFS family n=1 Tax=Terribacillus halophilus TaxID=361279 RepID=A0A1G6W9X2_9BACI|nr:MFS transporter [Terribacillus halophilus]SDD62631.1 Predicted arabinose efflux permease, MFS family [Terribacillus halophilus]
MNPSKNKVIGIALITAIALLGDALFIIVLPLQWQEFGLISIWQVGLLLSINRFIRLPINPLVGMFYQRFQLRTGILISLIIAVFTTASYGFFKEFWLLFTMRALWGVAWSFLRIGGYLTVIETTTEANHGKNVGLYNGLWGLGGLVGMLAGGILVDQSSIKMVTTLFSLIGILTIPAVIYFVPSTKNNSKQIQDKAHVKEWINPYITLVLITGAVMGFIVFGLFASTLSRLIEDAYHAEWTVLHVTIGAATLTGFIQALRWAWDPFIAPKIGVLIDKRKIPAHVILFPLFAGGIIISTLVSIKTVGVLIILLLFFQMVSTLFVTTTDALAVKAAAKSDKVKVMTAYTIVIDIGAALGPLLAFIVLDMYSLNSIYYLSGIIMISLGISWLVYIHTRLR